MILSNSTGRLEAGTEVPDLLPTAADARRLLRRPCLHSVTAHDDDRNGLGLVHGHKQRRRRATAQADRLCISTPNTT